MYNNAAFNKVAFVIGSNYGDEGKGQTTREVVERLVENGEVVLNVRYGGSAQAGHTVVADGQRIVYKHFGAGSFLADTYLGKDFIVNPIFFQEEYNNLFWKGNTKNCYISPDCIITTPEMMTLNQLAEVKRGASAHGSCGMGVYESILAKEAGIVFRVGDLVGKSYQELSDYFFSDESTAYYKKRYYEINDDDETYKYIKSMRRSHLFLNTVVDMLTNSIVAQMADLKRHTAAVFESSQGMLLTEKYGVMPHCTPSLINLSDMLPDLNVMTEPKQGMEVYFVTRSYTTRHGNGPLNAEASMEDLGLSVYDPTNVPNKFQGSIRYAPLDVDLLRSTIKSEIDLVAGSLKWDIKYNLVVTCTVHSDNYVKTLKGDLNMFDFMEEFNKPTIVSDFLFPRIGSQCRINHANI